MGTDRRPAAPGLADALFSSVQQRVLALLFGHPERSFQSAELIRLVKGGTGGVHRELTRLAQAGWVTVTPIGNQRHYRANRACPAFRELSGLVVKTLGIPRTDRRSPLRRPEVVAVKAEREVEPERGRETVPPPDESWKSW
jgi:hypothetical protein